MKINDKFCYIRSTLCQSSSGGRPDLLQPRFTEKPAARKMLMTAWRKFSQILILLYKARYFIYDGIQKIFELTGYLNILHGLNIPVIDRDNSVAHSYTGLGCRTEHRHFFHWKTKTLMKTTFTLSWRAKPFREILAPSMLNIKLRPHLSLIEPRFSSFFTSASVVLAFSAAESNLGLLVTFPNSPALLAG